MKARLRALVRRAALRHERRSLAGAARAVTTPARLVTKELAFIPLRGVAELAARGGPRAEGWRRVERVVPVVARYRLRGSGRPVWLHHGGADYCTLYETHCSGDYMPPSEAERALGTRARALRIVDLGANVGFFGAFALDRWPGSQLVAFEPDPHNLGVLRRTVAAAERDHWEVVPACAGVEAGEVPFMSGYSAESRVAAGGELVRQVDVFPFLADADLVKIDIEGGEWPILLDERFAGLDVGAVVMEYHAWGCPGPDPAALASDALRRSGLEVGDPQRHDWKPGFGLLWAWRPGA